MCRHVHFFGEGTGAEDFDDIVFGYESGGNELFLTDSGNSFLSERFDREEVNGFEYDFVDVGRRRWSGTCPPWKPRVGL